MSANELERMKDPLRVCWFCYSVENFEVGFLELAVNSGGYCSIGVCVGGFCFDGVQFIA